MTLSVSNSFGCIRSGLVCPVSSLGKFSATGCIRVLSRAANLIPRGSSEDGMPGKFAQWSWGTVPCPQRGMDNLYLEEIP